MKDNESANNKGVNVTSDSLEPTGASASQPRNLNPIESINNVKNQLKNVIDLMGPTTPHLTYSISNEADNEDSFISSTSIISSLVVKQTSKIEKPPINNDQVGSTLNSPRDFSEYSAVTDLNTQQTDVFDDSYTEGAPCNCHCPVMPPPPVCMHPGCTCAYSVGYAQQMPVNYNYGSEDEQKNYKRSRQKCRLQNWLAKFKNPKEMDKNTMELYSINIVQAKDDHSPPRKVVFDLVDGIPKPDAIDKCTCTHSQFKMKNAETVTKTQTFSSKAVQNSNIYTPYHSMLMSHHQAQTKRMDTIHNSENSYHNPVNSYHNPVNSYHNPVNSYQNPVNSYQNPGVKREVNEKMEKIDIYYFDHGNSAYYRTTDAPPLVMTELVAERTEQYATKFWAEFFGTVYIGFAFVTTFILQLVRFILYSLLRPLTVGIVQLTSDYCFKPCLAALFNAIIQPPLIFFYNVATSLRDLCDPIAEGLGYFLREIAVVFRAIRIVDIRNSKKCDVDSNAKTKNECKTQTVEP